MNNSRFDLVIFDCDGVLVNSEPLTNQVYVQMLGEYGHQVNTDEYLREFYGATMRQRLEATSTKLTWDPPSNFLSIFNERLSRLTETELQPVPGIHELLDSLSTPICIASNGSQAEIRLRLRIANLTKYFENAIFSGLETPHPKPAPDVYLAAASAFNASPLRCIVIEDSIPGVTAAVRAGMKVYGHAAFLPSESLQQAGAIPFANMLKLKDMIADKIVEQ